MKKEIKTGRVLELFQRNKSLMRDVNNIRPIAECDPLAKRSLLEIETELDAVQKRAKVRMLSVADILAILVTLDEKFSIPKYAKKGIIVDVDRYAEKFASAYKYTPESTQFTATHNGKEWIITDIRRDSVKQHQNRFDVKLTDLAKEKIIEQYEKF